MKAFTVERPGTLVDALALKAGKTWLAGGQSLLASMKLGMNQADALIDLQDVPELRGINIFGSPSVLQLGAMQTHASIGNAQAVRAFCPGLVELANGIADQQVRNMGTIGGAVANNDPAACWPAGVLALNATIVSSKRELSADEFFTGIFATTLGEDELLTQIQFPRPTAFKYLKFEQPASRFALLGVAVACFGPRVRVAITGLGQGVQRWGEAEQALCKSFAPAALEGLVFPIEQAMSDLHASAQYRAHLALVLCRRAVQSITRDTPSTLDTHPSVSRRPSLLARARVGIHAIFLAKRSSDDPAI